MKKKELKRGVKKKSVLGLGGVLGLWFLIAVLWIGYRLLFHLPEWADELVFKPLIFVLPVVLWVRFYERRSWQSVGLTRNLWFKSLLWGLGLGIVWTGEGILMEAYKSGNLVFNPRGLSLENIAVYGLISLGTGFSEEFLNRGFVMSRLWEIEKSEVWANLGAACLFAGLHLPMAVLVLGYAGNEILTYIFLMFVLGVLDGFVFGRTRNLLGPTLSHSIWNFGVILWR